MKNFSSYESYNIKRYNDKIVESTDPYKYHPKTKEQLKRYVADEIRIQGNRANLNCIDTSAIEDMSEIFASTRFNGDISQWDVSNVKNMMDMFAESKFNQDISCWDVSKVKDLFIDEIFNLSDCKYIDNIKAAWSKYV